jgi:site-specific DNA-methyltransferase (adenine-specific)
MAVVIGRRTYKMIRLQHCGVKNADGDRAGRFHPTQKPVVLFRRILELFPKANFILDPFLGSGTTLLAAKQLGRRAIGIEIEEKYCEIAAKRLANEPMPLFKESVEASA